MASTILPSIEQPIYGESEILSEEQIEKLLQEAEDRLRQQAGLMVATDTSSAGQQPKTIPKLRHGLDDSVSMKQENGVMVANRGLEVTEDQRKLATSLRSIETQKSTKANDITNSGPQWFNMPKTELTPQLKRDLQMIEMRSVLDPHRHYKKNTRRGQVPVFSQTGTVVEGPTEFFSGRINKKDRSKNFVEEAMKTETGSGRFKRKYDEIQQKKTSGKKAHYKKLMAKRKKS